ncbi:MAG: DUF1934 family protein [Candidatus Gallimonas sp.]
MNTCSLEIVTYTEGTRGRTRASGTYRGQGDGAVVRYLQDGDEVALTVSETECVMQRRGAVELTMRFTLSSETALVLTDGGSSGSVPLRTSRYSFERRGDGFRLALCYSLRYPAGKQRYSVKINAEIISEEK